MAAVRGGSLAAVQTLLEAGADANRSTMTPDEQNIFKLAASFGRTEIARAITAHLAKQNINATFNGGYLIEAAKNGHVEMTEFFVEPITRAISKQPELADRFKPVIEKSIELARSTGQQDVVDMLEKRRVAREAPTHVIAAAITGDLARIRSLIQAGQNPNEMDTNGRSPLIAATSAGHLEAVKLLLELGAQPDARQDEKPTALITAFEHNQVKIAQALLEAGADPNITAIRQHPDMLVNSQKHSYLCPLAIAAGKKRHRLFNLLLAHGVDINAPIGDVTQGEFAMVEAGAILEPSITGYLSGKGVDINAKDPHGQTILHRAAMSMISEDELDLLIFLGADPGIRNREGENPLETANRSRHSISKDEFQRVGKTLLAQQGDNSGRSSGSRPGWPSPWYAGYRLNQAAAAGDVSEVRAMIKHDASIDAVDLAGRPAIVLAAENGHVEVIQLLLGLGADLTGKNIWRETPHEVAAQAGQDEALDTLNQWFESHGTPKKLGLNDRNAPSVPGLIQ
jgi:ankyrin repeat protein